MDKLSVVDQKPNNHSKSCLVDATSLYLKEIGRSPLLSADEEVFSLLSFKREMRLHVIE